MLVELKSSTPNNCLYVVDQNADDPSNFAEYRVGTDLFDPANGCRVIAGRVTNSAFSSLNFSYVNDAQWATVDGTMNVPAIVVVDGDAFGSLEGIIAYTFGAMKLVPRNNDDANFIAGCGVSINDAFVGDVTLYPNPAGASFNLRYSIEGNVAAATATISDIMGRIVKTVALDGNNGEVRVDASDFAEGQYILKVTTDGGAVVDVVKFARMR